MSRQTTPSGDDMYVTYNDDAEMYMRVTEEDKLTAIPHGWEPPVEYHNRGRPEDDCVIREAGWCPRCKEKLDFCICIHPEDLFDELSEEDE